MCATIFQYMIAVNCSFKYAFAIYCRRLLQSEIDQFVFTSDLHLYIYPYYTIYSFLYQILSYRDPFINKLHKRRLLRPHEIFNITNWCLMNTLGDIVIGNSNHIYCKIW